MLSYLIQDVHCPDSRLGVIKNATMTCIQPPVACHPLVLVAWALPRWSSDPVLSLPVPVWG